ncbi:MAG: recombinase family protein, partial [Hyphomicrobiaceae bacterium]
MRSDSSCVSSLARLRAKQHARTTPLSKRGSVHYHASRDLRTFQFGPAGRPVDNRSVGVGERICRPASWQIIAEFTDAAISGASMVNRPGLNELMRAAEARNFDVVLTESLDRLSRDLADSAGLHRQLVYWGVRIVTLADGDVNKMLVAVKGLLE